MTDIRVLLIDDDQDDHLFVAEMLSATPEIVYELECVGDYDSGLRALIDGAYDVALVDYRLGGRGGLDLIREAIDYGCDSPLIVLTRQLDRAIDLAAMEAGAHECLTKGAIDGRLLDRAIRYALHRSRAAVQQKLEHDELERSNRRLKALAMTDPLTGLANRRRFFQAIREQMSLADRLEYQVSVVVLDVDQFKLYNDTFGHPAGDEALRSIAAILKASARACDLVARNGGEEFAVLVPAADAPAAVIVAERLRSAIERHAWSRRRLTASFGVATSQPRETEPANLLEQADRALYQSKKEGRNRVTHQDDLGRGAGESYSGGSDVKPAVTGAQRR